VDRNSSLVRLKMAVNGGPDAGFGNMLSSFVLGYNGSAIGIGGKSAFGVLFAGGTILLEISQATVKSE
jgi:hypothetical protein